MKIKNSKGTVYYGLHFYPGVAEYKETPDKSFKIFVNSDAIMKMNRTFQGCPLFLDHVDEVPEDLRQLKVEADGWVIRSFFNEADGKTWAEFIVVSPRAEWAIKNGYTLSNAYVPKGPMGSGGIHNGVEYDALIMDGEFEHLALVKTPRYEESIILTPESFKSYNSKLSEQRFKLANSKETPPMGKFQFFKKAKVENEIDETMSVVLPKSGKETTLTKLINEADDMAMNSEKPVFAQDSHMVKMNDGSEMSVADFKKKHEDCMNELAALKEKKEGMENEEDMEEGEHVENVEGKEGAVQQAEHEEEEVVEKKIEGKKQNSKMFVTEEEKAKRARNLAKVQNARELAAQIEEDVEVIDLSFNKLQRGQERYGKI